MADWTDIDTQDLEPGRPARSIQAIALRDNPVAIAEGAAGAPRVRTAGLQPPAAGTSNLIFRLQDAEVSTGETGYLDAGFNNRYSASQHLGVVCLVPGVVTAYVEHRTGTEFSGTSYIRFLKNGAPVQEFSTTADVHQVRSVNISVNTGDVIIFQQRRDAANADPSYWRNLRIYSVNPDMAVC